MAQTGGLPGVDAYNEIIIERNSFHDGPDREALQKRLGAIPAAGDPRKALGMGGQTIRIPLRLPPGASLPFSPEDVVLHSGDVVFLEAHEDKWYYTGGLLPPGKHLLPRDHDLDVVEALTEVHGPLFNGAFGGSNLSGALIEPGIGNPSPSLLTVVRRMPEVARCLSRSICAAPSLIRVSASPSSRAICSSCRKSRRRHWPVTSAKHSSTSTCSGRCSAPAPAPAYWTSPR